MVRVGVNIDSQKSRIWPNKRFNLFLWFFGHIDSKLWSVCACGLVELRSSLLLECIIHLTISYNGSSQFDGREIFCVFWTHSDFNLRYVCAHEPVRSSSTQWLGWIGHLINMVWRSDQIDGLACFLDSRIFRTQNCDLSTTMELYRWDLHNDRSRSVILPCGDVSYLPLCSFHLPCPYFLFTKFFRCLQRHLHVAFQTPKSHQLYDKFSESKSRWSS